MPDHLHLLVEALAADSCLLAFVKDFKQRSGFVYKQSCGVPLWQDGYHDHIIRGDEVVMKLARYLLENPVRVGLVRHPLDWQTLGSLVLTVEELLDLATEVPR